MMNRIPTSEYLECQGSIVVTMSMFELYHSPSEVEAFCSWLCGQTGMVMDDGTHAIYAHDYERWLEQGKQDCQSPFDWD